MRTRGLPKRRRSRNSRKWATEGATAPVPEAARSLWRLREEAPADYDAIREVNRLAFGGEVEARLVDRLREDGEVIASLVAVGEERVVGHILFSELPIETECGVRRGAALAPMAVRPGRQRGGIGSALVRRGRWPRE